ncbi:hypothetical protein BDZ89DRAFT_1164980 [Hymenopellis radicata]|nr:hypothetical protein BDZ89DRAFT_1164980 [Hymenopellis radicata]
MSDSSRSSTTSSSSSFREGQARRQALFDFGAPPLERKRNQHVPIPAAPFHFLDSHLSESLILRHVTILPSLHVDVFACLDSFSEELEALNPAKFTVHEFSVHDTADMANALSVMRVRRGPIRFASTQITSSLVLHPSQPDLRCSLLRWVGARSELRHTLLDEAYASQNLALHVVKPDATDYADLNGRNRELLERLRKHAEQLVSTMVFCTDALPSPPPDASAVPWALPSAEGPRRSRRVRLHEVQEPTTSSFNIGTVERDVDGEAGYSPRCEDYVQKAWVCAVKTDTTVIVFDCGNFIRIGIRHRERETLFLSNLIDIRTCKDPAYGGLWTALQVAAASDALQRLPLLENAASSKRKSTFDAPHHQFKRRKTDYATSKDKALHSFDKTTMAAKFSALALFFRFDLFESPAPRMMLLVKTRLDEEGRRRKKGQQFCKHLRSVECTNRPFLYATRTTNVGIDSMAEH